MSNPLNQAINILGIREDDAWCAIALEMSLRGYGVTFDEALDELYLAIEAQISFALQHNSVEQVFIPAEPHYFNLYAEMKRKALKHKLLNRKQSEFPDYRVGNIFLPDPTEERFTLVTA